VARRNTDQLGNFWVDLTRLVMRVLLPIAVLGTIVFIAAGMVQNLSAGTDVTTLTGGTQVVPGGPVASQEVIKELGTNGGGFFNVNSAFPFENATTFANFVELLFILLVPAAATYQYGRMIGRQGQGWALYIAMLLMLAIGVGNAYYQEAKATPALTAAGVHATADPGSTGGNLQDKEQRFGIANSALWSTATTDASNGSVNAAQEAYSGFGGMTPLVNMMTGEVIFGGVGSGLYGMLLLVLLTVFLAGLMVGRTPEYLGKKIQAREVKLVAIGTLYMPVVVLVAAALAVATPAGKKSIYDSGPQGFSEAVYAYTSQTNNNGSAFAGYTGFVQPNAPGNEGATGVPFADLIGGLCMLLGRFVPLLAALAVAGSLAAKRPVPAGPGTFRTDSPIFLVLLVGVVVIVAALSFLPALALGPIVQGLTNQLF
jgi:potassium-transporting ATPase potassium-binding subunit